MATPNPPIPQGGIAVLEGRAQKKGAPKDAQKIHLFPKEQGASKGECAELENRQRVFDDQAHFIQVGFERRGTGGGLAHGPELTTMARAAIEYFLGLTINHS